MSLCRYKNINSRAAVSYAYGSLPYKIIRTSINFFFSSLFSAVKNEQKIIIFVLSGYMFGARNNTGYGNYGYNRGYNRWGGGGYGGGASYGTSGGGGFSASGGGSGGTRTASGFGGTTRR